VREMCLAHKVGETDSERSYDRAEMLPQRRAALQAWGVYCCGMATANANVPAVEEKEKAA